MLNDPFSKNSIFISWGKFRAGATGPFGIGALLDLAAALILAHSCGWI
jgi:hypothetical protein